jgi:hypothetical protein
MSSSVHGGGFKLLSVGRLFGSSVKLPLAEVAAEVSKIKHPLL